MKKYRRIEITAFRRRIFIASGDPTTDSGDIDVLVNDADSQLPIETGSEEGQEILRNAIRLLEERISQKRRRNILPHPSDAGDGT